MKGIVLVVAVLLASETSFAHKGKVHASGSRSESAAEASAQKPARNLLAEINESYLRDVKPIFKKKCFDCHSQDVRYPWYHAIPGIKAMIDHDIAEGREHLDFSNDFPFGGHGTPAEDLDEIKASVAKDEMPPFQYRLMHSDARLTPEEKRVLFEWVERSLQTLGQ